MMSDNQEAAGSVVQTVRSRDAEGVSADGERPAEHTSASEPTGPDEGLAYLRTLLEQQDLANARAFVAQLQKLWPDSDRVEHFVRILAPPTITLQPAQAKHSRNEEYRWLCDHAEEYPGCWVALLGYDLIAADPDFRVVVAAVRKLERANDALLHFQPRPMQ